MKLKEILAFIISTAVALLLVFKVKPKPIALPHPKELVDYNRNMDNTKIKDVLMEWFMDWGVTDPVYWRDKVEIKLDVSTPYPAWTSAETKVIGIRPEYANPGTIAHEAAHISYGLLTDEEKQEFVNIYTPLVNKGLIKELYKQNAYGLSSIVEGHAEVYRYLAQEMPEDLKQFYPKLMA